MRGDKYTISGVSKTVTQWAETTGIPAKVIIDRLQDGWSISEAVKTPVNYRESYNCSDGNRHHVRMIDFNGQIKTLSEWADLLGINKSTLNIRLKNYDVETALTKKKGEHSV